VIPVARKVWQPIGAAMRPDRRRHQAAFFAPGKEPVAGPGISAARARVADIGGEEFEEAHRRAFAGGGDERRE